MPSPRPTRLGRSSSASLTLGQRLAVGRRRPLRVAGAAGRVLLEDPVDDRALGDDRRVLVVGVRRVQLGDLGVGVVDPRQHPVDLVLHVAAQVPRHRLEPGERVDRGPVLRRVVEPAEPQQGVLRGELARAVLGEVGVDAVGVRLERLAGPRLEQRQLPLGDPAPAHRPDHLVGLERLLAEQLGEPPGGDVPAHVHLEEPLLGLHVALRQHQVVHRVGVQLRDAVLVADHLDRAGQARHLELAGGLRQRATDHGDAGDRHHDQQQDEPGRDVRRPAGRGRPAAEGRAPPHPPRVRTGGLHAGRVRPRGRWWGCSWCCHCAVGFGSQDRRVPAPREDKPVPTYQYACTECGHRFEAVQSFHEDSLTHCPECDGRLRKVFNAVGVVFKGSGFYRNDSRSGAASVVLRLRHGLARRTPARTPSDSGSWTPAPRPGAPRRARRPRRPRRRPPRRHRRPRPPPRPRPRRPDPVERPPAGGPGRPTVDGMSDAPVPRWRPATGRDRLARRLTTWRRAVLARRRPLAALLTAVAGAGVAADPGPAARAHGPGARRGPRPRARRGAGRRRPDGGGLPRRDRPGRAGARPGRPDPGRPAASRRAAHRRAPGGPVADRGVRRPGGGPGPAARRRHGGPPHGGRPRRPGGGRPGRRRRAGGRRRRAGARAAPRLRGPRAPRASPVGWSWSVPLRARPPPSPRRPCTTSSPSPSPGSVRSPQTPWRSRAQKELP